MNDEVKACRLTVHRSSFRLPRFNRGDEVLHELKTFAAGRGLDAAANVDGVGADRVDCVGDVRGLEAAREEEARHGLARGARELPVERVARRSEERRVGNECRSRWSPYH